MQTTVGDQIVRALRLLGVLAEGESPSAVMAQDALISFNQMVDSWSTESLAVYNTQDQVFTWPSGVASQTLGPTGDFVGVRPVSLADSTYFRDEATNVSFGVKQVSQAQYNGIAVKTVTSTYPQIMWINMEYPDIQITVYPVPTRPLEWHFVSVQELSQAEELADMLELPPGYLRALVYNLAMEIAPEYGVEPPQQVQRIAMTSKRDLKRINTPDDKMSMPYTLVTSNQRYNIYAGNL